MFAGVQGKEVLSLFIHTLVHLMNLSLQTIRRTFLNALIPGQLVIQLTDRCNATCPQCGMRVTEMFPRSRLGSAGIKRVLHSAAKQGIRMVSFTGGEPFLYLDDLIELINFAGKCGFTYIRTGTNGYLFRRCAEPGFTSRVTALAKRLAATPLRNLWFSIDSSVPSIHEQMRGFPGVMEGMAKALPIFHAHGIYPSANLGLNRNITAETAQLKPLGPDCSKQEEQAFYQCFHRGLDQFYQALITLGFTMTSTCYPMSVDTNRSGDFLTPVYGATAADMVIRFNSKEKRLLYRALAASVARNRHRIRIVTPLYALQGLIREDQPGASTGYPCLGGHRYFFIDCKDGQTYPCGYRGQEPLGPFWQLSDQAITASRAYECQACDWECFRDPSELFGPIINGLSQPLSALINSIRKRKDASARLWRADLRYAGASGFFHGRKNIRKSRLLSFAPTGQNGG